MRFYEVLTQIIGLLALERRVSYQALKRRFDLDDAYLADVKAEIIDVHRLAVAQDGTMLVWTGGIPLTPTAAPAQPPLSTCSQWLPRRHMVRPLPSPRQPSHMLPQPSP